MTIATRPGTDNRDVRVASRGAGPTKRGNGQADRRSATGSTFGLPVVDLATLRAEAQRQVDEGWLPYEAARLALDAMRPDATATKVLLEVGLKELVNSNLAIRRSAAAKGIARIMPPSAAQVVIEDPLDLQEARPSGEMARLLDWTHTDWTEWEKVCEAQAEGWANRQFGASEIAALLVKHRVVRTGDLPPTALEKVRKIVKGFRA